MKAPFPWFGGKSEIADVIWDRFGDVDNYVEPFFGSGAVLLNRPQHHRNKIETINDKDAFLTNFWRALKFNPTETAKFADWPVNEIDLAARRDWLFSHTDLQSKMESDPFYYDAELAGVWVWGVCSTIGNAWQPKATHLGDAGRGEKISTYFNALSKRFERVRVMCGDWSRVTSKTVTTHNGLTGMFLDPPYLDNCTATYNHNDDVRPQVFEYAIEHGHEMRIAVCGYEGEHGFPKNWTEYAWKARGGYGSQGDGRGKKNSTRERIWFSPLCLTGQEKLF